MQTEMYPVARLSDRVLLPSRNYDFQPVTFDLRFVYNDALPWTVDNVLAWLHAYSTQL